MVIFKKARQVRQVIQNEDEQTKPKKRLKKTKVDSSEVQETVSLSGRGS